MVFGKLAVRQFALGHLVGGLLVASLLVGCGGDPVDIEGAPLEGVRLAFSGSELRVVPGPNIAIHDIDADTHIYSDIAYAATNSLPAEAFRLDGKAETTSHAFGDVTLAVPKGRPLRVCVVRLKDREFHPSNPAEVRRIEARKWGSKLKRILETGEDVVVMAEVWDSADSAVLSALAVEPLGLLRPVDNRGAAWTHHDPEDDSYHRWSYCLVSPSASNRVINTWIDTAPDAPARTLYLQVKR